MRLQRFRRQFKRAEVAVVDQLPACRLHDQVNSAGRFRVDDCSSG